jgi:transcriptional regulator with XRE-family HTH domain
MDVTDLRKVVGANVSSLRRKNGLSQEKLADLVKLNKQTVWRIEAGASNVSLETLARIAPALGVTPADLLLGVDDKNPSESLVKLLDSIIASMRKALTLAQELRPVLRRVS